MRRFLFALLAAVALNASAQSSRPANLQPLPEPPPPPRSLDDPLEPQVTITKRGEDKVEEFRMNGRLYKVKVTPPHGVPYYLVDDRGDGSFARRDIQDSGLRVPMWVIGTF
jgi:hypothetical protein